MRRLIAAAAAVVGVAALASPAGAAPTNAKNSLTFVDTVCTNLNPPNVTRTLDFVVNGGGRGVAHTPAGVFQPLSLELRVNGELSLGDSFEKNNVGKADWSCNGQTTIEDPEAGPIVISFTALGTFH
jgi:hypothetical protein